MSSEYNDFASEGCHEEDNPALEVMDLKKKVHYLEQWIEHLKWHLFVYRSALLESSDGHDILHRELKEFHGVPICLSCEKDALLSKIKYLEMCDQTSPILGSSKRRRKTKTD